MNFIINYEFLKLLFLKNKLDFKNLVECDWFNLFKLNLWKKFLLKNMINFLSNQKELLNKLNPCNVLNLQKLFDFKCTRGNLFNYLKSNFMDIRNFKNSFIFIDEYLVFKPSLNWIECGSIREYILKSPILLKKYFLKWNLNFNGSSLNNISRIFWNNGILCYIPTKVTSTKCQLNVYYLLTFKNNYNIFLYNLIIAEEYSKLEIVQYFELIKDKFYSTNNLKGNLFITSDIHLKKNTDFKFFNVSNLNSNASVFQNSNFYLKYNSHAQTLDLNFANKLNHTDKMIYLKSSGSRINTYVLNILLDNCEYTGNVNQIHLDKNTYSKVYQKNILLNSAKVYFKGLILLDKKSKDSCADQLNTSICLTQQNVVCSIPTIEILNKNVKCTHGSSTGSFSSDEFFYMLSRGLNIIKIVKLFIFSFIYDIIKQFIIVNTKYIDLLNNSVRII